MNIKKSKIILVSAIFMAVLMFGASTYGIVLVKTNTPYLKQQNGNTSALKAASGINPVEFNQNLSSFFEGNNLK